MLHLICIEWPCWVVAMLSWNASLTKTFFLQKFSLELFLNTLFYTQTWIFIENHSLFEYMTWGLMMQRFLFRFVVNSLITIITINTRQILHGYKIQHSRTNPVFETIILWVPICPKSIWNNDRNRFIVFNIISNNCIMIFYGFQILKILFLKEFYMCCPYLGKVAHGPYVDP